MGPRLRGDDEVLSSVIPAHAGIQTDLSSGEAGISRRDSDFRRNDGGLDPGLRRGDEHSRRGTTKCIRPSFRRRPESIWVRMGPRLRGDDGIWPARQRH